VSGERSNVSTGEAVGLYVQGKLALSPSEGGDSKKAFGFPRLVPVSCDHTFRFACVSSMIV
jgi:hypothetical protein